MINSKLQNKHQATVVDLKYRMTETAVAYEYMLMVYDQVQAARTPECEDIQDRLNACRKEYLGLRTEYAKIDALDLELFESDLSIQKQLYFGVSKSVH